MQTSLLAIANKAKDRKHYRFLNLYRLIDENLLLACWRDIRQNAAYGVDRVSAQQYGENLIENIRNLIERLKRKSYPVWFVVTTFPSRMAVCVRWGFL